MIKFHFDQTFEMFCFQTFRSDCGFYFDVLIILNFAVGFGWIGDALVSKISVATFMGPLIRKVKFSDFYMFSY